MASKKHTHKYYYVDIRFAKVWACALDNCSHYMPPHLVELTKSLASICFDCGNRFLLDAERMKDAITNNDGKGRCLDCELRSKGTDTNALNDFLNN